MDVTSLHTAAGHPDREGIDVMIAPRRVANLGHRSAPKLASPDDERFIEQTAPLEVAHQCRARLIGFESHFVEIGVEILAAPP